MVHRKFVLKAAAISRQSSGRNGEGSDAGGSDGRVGREGAAVDGGMREMRSSAAGDSVER